MVRDSTCGPRALAYSDPWQATYGGVVGLVWYRGSLVFWALAFRVRNLPRQACEIAAQ